MEEINADTLSLHLDDIFGIIDQIDGKSSTVEMFFNIYELLENGLTDKSELDLFRTLITCRLIDHVFASIKQEHHLKTWNQMQAILITEYIHQVESLRCRTNLCDGLRLYINHLEKIINCLGRDRGILIKDKVMGRENGNCQKGTIRMDDIIINQD